MRARYDRETKKLGVNVKAIKEKPFTLFNDYLLNIHYDMAIYY
jgi:hypothetical protein